MSVNILVLTDKSFAATSVEDVRQLHGYVCRERLATKGEFLKSPIYNRLLNLDATQAGLLELSLDDILGTCYQLQIPATALPTADDFISTSDSTDSDSSSDSSSSTTFLSQDDSTPDSSPDSVSECSSYDDEDAEPLAEIADAASSTDVDDAADSWVRNRNFYETCAKLQDPLPELTDAERSALEKLRFYTVGDYTSLDVKSIRSDFDGLLLLMTQPLGVSSNLSLQLFNILEAMCAPQKKDHAVFNSKPLPLMVFNLSFIRADVQHYEREKQKAKTFEDAYKKARAKSYASYSSTRKSDPVTVDPDITFPFIEEYRSLERLLKLLTSYAQLITVQHPLDQSFLQRFYPKFKDCLCAPNVLYMCNSRARIQSIVRTMRLLLQVQARTADTAVDADANTSTASAAAATSSSSSSSSSASASASDDAVQQQMLPLQWALRAPLTPVLARSRREHQTLSVGQGFRKIEQGKSIKLEWTDLKPYGALGREQLKQFNTQRPLTIALNSLYLACHPAIGTAPLGLDLITQVFEAFPNARIILLFDETFYSWLEQMPSLETQLTERSSLVVNSSRGYIELDSSFTQLINTKAIYHTLLRHWLLQEPMYPAATTAITAQSKHSASALQVSMAQVLGLKPFARAEHDAWARSLEKGASLSAYAQYFASLHGIPQPEVQGLYMELIKKSYLMLDYSRELPDDIDLLLSDNEGLLLQASAHGIATLQLCNDLHLKAGGGSSAIAPMDSKYITASLCPEMLVLAPNSNEFLAPYEQNIAQKIEQMPQLFLADPSLQRCLQSADPAASSSASKDNGSSSTRAGLPVIRGSMEGEFSALVPQLSFAAILGSGGLREQLQQEASYWDAGNIAAQLQAYYRYAHDFKVLLYQNFLAKREEAATSDAEAASSKKEKGSGLALQVPAQWSNYTYAQRYERQWQFLRFFYLLNRCSEFGHPVLLEVLNYWQSLTLGIVSEPPVKSDLSNYHGGTDSVLSFGCARGDEIWDLNHFFPDKVFIGSDINLGALEHAKLLASQELAFQGRAPWDGRLVPGSGYKLFWHPAELDKNLKNIKAPKCSLVIAMTVLCRHPETLDPNAQLQKLYPYELFVQQLKGLYRRMEKYGLLCVFNSNYAVDTVLSDATYKGSMKLNRLFPFPRATKLVPLPALDAPAVKVKVGSKEYNLHLNMSVVDYWKYLLSTLQKLSDNPEQEIYLPAAFCKLYATASESELFGYTACFDAQGRRIPAQQRGSIFYKP